MARKLHLQRIYSNPSPLALNKYWLLSCGGEICKGEREGDKCERKRKNEEIYREQCNKKGKISVKEAKIKAKCVCQDKILA
jgi:hypothetical protein